MTRQAFEAQEVRRLYEVAGWTAGQLAAHYGCANQTILRRLKDLGIARRPRGPQPKRLKTPLTWSPEMAWVVGLITTDGNLSKDGRHISVVSKDRDLLETVKDCLKLNNRIGLNVGKLGTTYRLAWSNREMYQWLLSIGLMPAKSLRLGPLAVPDEYLADFMRGCIDGDGSVATYVDDYNTPKSEAYVYTRLFVMLVSASHDFVEWLQAAVQRQIGVQGALFVRPISQPQHAPLWTLKYAKREAITLLRWIYHSPGVPCLQRKWEIAKKFVLDTNTGT